MTKRKKDLQGLYLIKDSLKTRIDELTALYEVSRSITSSVNLDTILTLIVKKVASILKADICVIYMLNEGDIAVKTSYGIKKNSALSMPLPLKNSMIARAIKRKDPTRIENVVRCSNDMFCKAVKAGAMRSILVVPLIKNDRSIGAIACCAKRHAAFSQDDERELALFASQAAVAIENARLFEEIKTNYLNTMKLLASVIDAKDTYTEDHSECVMRLSLGIADTLGVSERTRSIVKYASLLHDIGKIGIDISILRKPAPLTKEEWSEMKSHPRSGADIIKKAGFLDDLVPAILYHHVKYSGGGYPVTAKKRDAIPVEARILAVADAYEAMTSDRPYRRHLSIDQAIAELKRCSGDQFDPKVVKALIKYLKRR
jgi:putative methionine-R-sulfoxide reductase with GAF domain